MGQVTRFTEDCLVAGVVTGEPVSMVKFPANPPKTGKFGLIGSQGRFFVADIVALSMVYGLIP